MKVNKEFIDTTGFVPIIGYEDLYMATPCGNVYSVRNNFFMKGGFDKDGYVSIVLSVNQKAKYFRRSRLILAAFKSNPENKPQVNHINGIRNDDRPDNLEWATGSENVRHSFDCLGKIAYNTGRTGIMANNGKIVYQYNDFNQCIDAFFSTRDAERKTGINHVGINYSCAGVKQKKAGGYYWKY